MGFAVKKAATEIAEKVKATTKVAKKFRFAELQKLMAELEVLVKQSNNLPGANPVINAHEFIYPFDHQSSYLKGEKPSDIIKIIEAAAPSLKCDCKPVRCKCSISDETTAQLKGMNCGFCGEAFMVGNALFYVEKLNKKLCPTCDRILNAKVYPESAVAYAVINLLEDASTEASSPLFQFKESLKLINESQRLVEQFLNND